MQFEFFFFRFVVMRAILLTSCACFVYCRLPSSHSPVSDFSHHLIHDISHTCAIIAQAAAQPALTDWFGGVTSSVNKARSVCIGTSATQTPNRLLTAHPEQDPEYHLYSQVDPCGNSYSRSIPAPSYLLENRAW